MSQSVNVDGFRLISGCVLVTWQWEWMNNGQPEEDSDNASHTSITVIPEKSDEEDEGDDIKVENVQESHLSQL